MFGAVVGATPIVPLRYPFDQRTVVADRAPLAFAAENLPVVIGRFGHTLKNFLGRNLTEFIRCANRQVIPGCFGMKARVEDCFGREVVTDASGDRLIGEHFLRRDGLVIFEYTFKTMRSQTIC